MKRLIGIICAIGLWTASASAALVYDVVDYNLDEELNFQAVDWKDYMEKGQWDFGPVSHSFWLPPDWVSASLAVNLAGAGRLELPEVYLNGIYVGTAGSGDGEVLGQNIYRLDSWTLGEQLITSLSEYNLMTIKVSFLDGWALHGFRLAGMRDIGSPTAPVPEPATMLLFGAGAAFAAFQRRKKQLNNNISPSGL